MIKKYGLELLGEDRLPHLVAEETYPAADDVNLTDPEGVTEFCKNVLRLHLRAEEYIYAIYLDTQGKVVGISEIAHGGINTAPLSARTVFVRGLLIAAVSVIMVHNHPSAKVEPSLADETITQHICDIGNLVGIKLLDHVIVGGNNNNIYYYSFRQEQNIIMHD